jgi:hypothetical protein
MNSINSIVALVAFALLATPALAQETKAKRTQNLATHFGPVTLDAKGYPDQKAALARRR